MHVPDGYLSPSTCATLGATMVPVWATATRRAQRVVTSRYAPLMALGAAYSFLLMMFNVPIPGGTTAHGVGAVLLAVLLGPWAAVVCVSVALLIQALFFGDGGVLVYGANAWNMAFVMPFAGYGAYRALTAGATLSSRRRALAAGLGGYVGINAAALCAAVELGLQPALFHTAGGTPLYSPFHLSQTVPAMLLAHLTVAGMVELVLTAGIVTYLQRANPPLLRLNHRGVAETAAQGSAPAPAWRWPVLGIAVMAALTPLGLLAPGGAFGEGAPVDLHLARYHLDAVPRGLNDYYGYWSHTLLGGYGFGAGHGAVLGYLLSAFVGIAAIGAIIAAGVAVGRRVGRRDRLPGPRAA
jgi:cobalt/nickel transport system permease protein